MDTYEYVLIVFLVVCGMFLVGVGIYYFADWAFLPKHEGVGRVVDRAYVAAHATQGMRYDFILKIPVPMTVNHSACWSIVVQLHGHRKTFDVGQSTYNTLPEGTQVNLEYTIGRFTKNVYIKGFV